MSAYLISRVSKCLSLSATAKPQPPLAPLQNIIVGRKYLILVASLTKAQHELSSVS